MNEASDPAFLIWERKTFFAWKRSPESVFPSYPRAALRQVPIDPCRCKVILSQLMSSIFARFTRIGGPSIFLVFKD